MRAAPPDEVGETCDVRTRVVQERVDENVEATAVEEELDVILTHHHRLPPVVEQLSHAFGMRESAAQCAVRVVDRVKPIEPIAADRLRQWIAALDDPAFAKRDAATTELAALGERTEPALRAALAANPSAEKRQRIEKLLAAPLDAPPAETLRWLYSAIRFRLARS